VAANGVSALSFPDYELVVVLATERSEILLIGGEREALDENLVQFQSVYHLQSVEVPNDDVGLDKDTAPATYLETLVGFLSTGNVLSTAGALDHRDLIVVPAEELLCSANNVSDDDGGSEGEDDVLVVRVQNQSLVHLALESDDC